MSSSPLSTTRFRIIFSTSWLIIIVSLVLRLRTYNLSWQASLIDGLISSFFLILMCLLVMNTLRYYTPRRERYFYILIWCIALTYAGTLLTQLLLDLLLKHAQGYSTFLSQSMPIRRDIWFLILACYTLICILWFNWEELKANEKRKQDIEKVAKDAELFKLRQQLQPHFLFNSLNSINALIGSRPQEARKMIQQLSDFLRGTLKKEEHQWVSFGEELQYLQLYLDIEKVRFANRLSAIIETDEATQQMKLPALLLQPIVENAIKFGLYDTTGEAIIRISAKREENNLVIKVENPFDPETSLPNKGTGFGLKSVQRRLYLLFARNDLLETQIKENNFATIVKIPQHE